MLPKCASTSRKIELLSGAVVCEHTDGSYHTLYYKCDSLKDLCVLHYTKRYMSVDKTELTELPIWQKITEGKYSNELYFIMLMCKDNVGK